MEGDLFTSISTLASQVYSYQATDTTVLQVKLKLHKTLFIPFSHSPILPWSEHSIPS